MPRTLLCTVRVQTAGAGGRTKSEHRGGAWATRGEVKGASALLCTMRAGEGWQDERRTEGGNKGRGVRGRQGRREQGEEGSGGGSKEQ